MQNDDVERQAPPQRSYWGTDNRVVLNPINRCSFAWTIPCGEKNLSFPQKPSDFLLTTHTHTLSNQPNEFMFDSFCFKYLPGICAKTSHCNLLQMFVMDTELVILVWIWQESTLRLVYCTCHHVSIEIPSWNKQNLYTYWKCTVSRWMTILRGGRNADVKQPTWARKKKQPDFPWNPGLFNRDPYFMVSENPHITG